MESGEQPEERLKRPGMETERGRNGKGEKERDRPDNAVKTLCTSCCTNQQQQQWQPQPQRRGLPREDPHVQVGSERTRRFHAPRCMSAMESLWLTGRLSVWWLLVKDPGQFWCMLGFSTTGSHDGAWARSTSNLVSFREQQFADCDTRDSSCDGLDVQ